MSDLRSAREAMNRLDDAVDAIRDSGHVVYDDATKAMHVLNMALGGADVAAQAVEIKVGRSGDHFLHRSASSSDADDDGDAVDTAEAASDDE